MKNQNSNNSQKNVNSTKVENVENVPTIQEMNSIKLSANLQDRLNKHNIVEKTKNGVKSIFKKEYSEKSKRSSIRTKLFNHIDLFILFANRGETTKCLNKFEEIKQLCKECYIAETSFKNIDEYCTANLEEPKKEKLKDFLQIIKENDLK